MSLVKDTQELIEITELVGREVSVEMKGREVPFYGTLHSLSSHGALVKGDTQGYIIFPWHNIELIQHRTKEETAEERLPVYEDIDEKEAIETIEIVDPPLRIVERIISDNEDYDVDYEDREETIILVQDEEGEEAIKINIDEEITVNFEKDMDYAKKIADQLNINKIIRDF